MSNRPSWDEYFLQISILTSKRSNCIKKNVGCVVVKDNRILSLGYNGTPSGLPNCFDGGCHRCNDNTSKSGENLDLCICLHAEENALLYIGSKELSGSTLYSTLMPCISCTKKIIQCGIKRVVYRDQYNTTLDKISLDLFNDTHILVKQMK
jgi:dCMP deaminase